MKINFKPITLSLFAAVLLAALIGWMLPATLIAETQTEVGIYPEKVYAYLANPSQALAWAPWFKKDPRARLSPSGPESGQDASLSWESDSVTVKNGTIIISETSMNSKIVYDVDFKGLKQKAKISFSLENLGSRTPLKCVFETEPTNNPFRRLLNKLLIEDQLKTKMQDALETIKFASEGKQRP